MNGSVHSGWIHGADNAVKILACLQVSHSLSFLCDCFSVMVFFLFFSLIVKCLALWVMWGLLCGHLVAFKAPKSWPNKFLINIWGGFSVIFIASYTANIAALIAGLFFHNTPDHYEGSVSKIELPENNNHKWDSYFLSILVLLLDSLAWLGYSFIHNELERPSHLRPSTMCSVTTDSCGNTWKSIHWKMLRKAFIVLSKRKAFLFGVYFYFYCDAPSRFITQF